MDEEAKRQYDEIMGDATRTAVRTRDTHREQRIEESNFEFQFRNSLRPLIRSIFEDFAEQLQRDGFDAYVRASDGGMNANGETPDELVLTLDESQLRGPSLYVWGYRHNQTLMFVDQIKRQSSLNSENHTKMTTEDVTVEKVRKRVLDFLEFQREAHPSWFEAKLLARHR
jgi:hypothetical protein